MTRFPSHLALISSFLLEYGNSEVFEVFASCRGVLWSHTFTGDCCSLSDLPNGGCRLEVVGGACNITGPIWDTDIVSATRSVCPPSAYNAIGGCNTDLDCPTKFCGSDGKCHDYSCQTFFDLSPVMDFDNDTSTELVCQPMEGDHDVLQYGCGKTVGGLVPEARGIGLQANEVCTGVSKNVAGDESIDFECYQLMNGTDFLNFTADAEAYLLNGNATTCTVPLFFYSSSYEITEFVNGNRVENKIATDGTPPSLTLNEDRAYRAMFGLITKTPDNRAPTPARPPVGGPTDPGTGSTSAPAQSPSLQSPPGSGAFGYAPMAGATIAVATLALLSFA